MKFPIPNGRAEEAAKDLANDCRQVAKMFLEYREADLYGELNASDKEHMRILSEQVKSFLEISFLDIETGEEFYVKDYATKRRYAYAQRLKAWMQENYQAFISALKH